MKVTVGPDGQPQKLRLPYRPTQVGEFEYVVEVKSLPDEDPKQRTTTAETRTVSVRKEQIRVLLVQSYPELRVAPAEGHAGARPTIEFHTVLQEADLEYAEIDRSALRVFPVRRDELFSYDVIIFGDVNPAFLSASAMQNLADFVTEKGGGVVFIAGPQFTPLALSRHAAGAAAARRRDDEPRCRRQSKRSPTASRSGRPTWAWPVRTCNWATRPIRPNRSGGTCRRLLVPGDADARSRRPACWPSIPRASVLKASRCRSSRCNTSAPARCCSMPPTKPGPGGFAWATSTSPATGCRRIRYLSRSKLLGKDRTAELSTDREEYPRGEPVRLRVRFFDERLAPAADDGVVVISSGKGTRTAVLTLRRSSANRGVFEGVLTRPAVGSYHAWVATPTLEGRAPADDFLRRRPGRRVRADADGRSRVEESRQRNARRRFTRCPTPTNCCGICPKAGRCLFESLAPIVLWNKWPLVLLFLGLMITEWIWRKRRGLL